MGVAVNCLSLRQIRVKFCLGPTFLRSETKQRVLNAIVFRLNNIVPSTLGRPFSALMLGLMLVPWQCLGQELAKHSPHDSNTNPAFIRQLTQGSFRLIDESGRILGWRQRGNTKIETISEQRIVESLKASRLTPEEATSLWDFFADQDNSSLATLPIIKALLIASDSPRAHEAIWSELSGLARAFPRKDRKRELSLLGMFERERATLLPLVADVRETDASGDEMVELMTKTTVFGADLEESVAYVSERIPAVVARRIEHDREAGRRQRWEYPAYESIIRWKDTHLVRGALRAPRSLVDLDAAGITFISVFNSLHALDEGFREVILRGLGPIEIFNAVVAGEQELYRLGTSGYRGFLHPIIMRGITESGSFEAFIERTLPREFGDDAARSIARRGMIFLRVASSFGLLEPVLETIRDRGRFLSDALTSLANPQSFEANSTVLMEVLTGRLNSPAGVAFKQALLEQLYDRFRSERSAAHSGVYGAILSVYQAVTEDRRDPIIDRKLALDETLFRIPFDGLFSPDGKGGFTHRLFMRMDEDVDAVESFKAFRILMRSLGATLTVARNFALFRVTAPRRTIEIYLNKPTKSGVQHGVTDIANALRGARVETVVGRGHTSIIAPLQSDVKRLLGNRVKDVALVFVGSCGGDASVRDLISTFGYKAYVTTKSTGWQLVNDAIIKTYVAAVLSLAPADRLSVVDVLNRATARFLGPGVDDALREDAALYNVNMTKVLTALVFETHVRPNLNHIRYADRD